MEADIKKAGFLSIVLIIGLRIALLLIWLFSQLAENVLEDRLERFDSSAIGFFETLQTSTLDVMYTSVTHMGSVWFVACLSAAVILFLWFKARDKWATLFFIIAVGGTGALTWLLKQIYERGRPSINEAIDAIGFSFPSGHSMGSLVFYGFLIYLVIRSRQNKVIKISLSIVLGLLVLLIGTSRIYLGAHFPSDIIAGYIAGTIWLTLCILVLEWIRWQRSSQIHLGHALQNIFLSSYGLLKPHDAKVIHEP
ncbi:phosphatase PAP2 family protein [Psychrobacter alimentarius]|uniref:phosphatase PAP2 family protein n=1 Tax=Psychrobacter alimentarius TaxID=261164 RepID=UPI001917F14D|nr:phosphatase PAP2 family protein [Psychrobacter alimentarius]